MPVTPLFVAVFLLLCAERALEIAINRRNTRRLKALGARWFGADGFGAIVGAQAVLFVGVLLEVALASWAGEHRFTLVLVLVLALAQGLRYWCITTLGERWSIRVVTLPDAPRIVRGPYRWFPHPNYVAVMIEAVALPLAFGAWVTVVVAAPLQLAALWRRVRIEERALGAAQPHA